MLVEDVIVFLPCTRIVHSVRRKYFPRIDSVHSIVTISIILWPKNQILATQTRLCLAGEGSQQPKNINNSLMTGASAITLKTLFDWQSFDNKQI